MENLHELGLTIGGFAVIALAAQQVGQFFAYLRLPLITGFLFTGILAGPFILGLMPEEVIGKLRFVDQVSLAFIAFAAGSELYVKELRGRFKSIAWITAGLVLCTFVLGTTALLMLANVIPLTRDLPTSSRVAMAILAGAILVARSPSAAIAIINELRAKGPFTQTVLGVTVIMDVVVIILFAVNSSAADALLNGLSFDFSFVLILALDLFLAVLFGYLLFKLLGWIIARPLADAPKTGLMLLSGFGVFLGVEELRHFSQAQLPFELLVEPLLVCMTGSFLLANFSDYRDDFLNLLHNSGGLIYVAFFTLTGASLELHVLVQTWPIALALFGVRLVGIFLGSFVGGVVAGEPMSHNRIRWLAFVTQAGVALGLAKEVAVEFPLFGNAFATMIISLVVLNETVGPILFKWTINHIGEAHARATTPQFDGEHDVLIFGLDDQALALARQLQLHGWQATIVSPQAHEWGDFQEAGVELCSIADLSLEALRQFDMQKADTIVLLLSDEENYTLCELIYEHFGTQTVVVRLNDPSDLERFHLLGALVVHPTTALVNLMDHFVRSPSATSLLLGLEAEQDLIEVQVRDPSLHGLALRDLRLPLDTLVLSLQRDGHCLISHGYTQLRLGDRVTIVGTPKSLEEVALRFLAN